MNTSSFKKMVSAFVVIVCIVPYFAAASSSHCAPNEIYIVRHVEKLIIAGERDPDLSPLGYQHARALDEKLKTIKFDRVMATQYKRTQLTVKPIAKRNLKKLAIYNAADVNSLATSLLHACQQNIIVAGHSNTVPELLKALGLKFKVTINGQNLNHEAEVYLNEKDDYDSLFKVNFSDRGKAEVTLLRF
ncbi:MAG TPA: hypothetical protein ENJ60_05360 [Aeromonadales bacterium]|nr:hypothetical protein [Aeromonadales bacterium]